MRNGAVPRAVVKGGIFSLTVQKTLSRVETSRVDFGLYSAKAPKRLNGHLGFLLV